MSHPAVDTYAHRHLRLGWWMLLGSIGLGLGLALLRASGTDAYLHPENTTRRLMWTLAHAHGALLALLHVLYGAGLRLAPRLGASRPRLASLALTAASLLLPGGFFLGGVTFYGGDPGLGVLAVPLGAVCLLAAVVLIARGSMSGGAADGRE